MIELQRRLQRGQPVVQLGVLHPQGLQGVKEEGLLLGGAVGFRPGAGAGGQAHRDLRVPGQLPLHGQQQYPLFLPLFLPTSLPTGVAQLEGVPAPISPDLQGGTEGVQLHGIVEGQLQGAAALRLHIGAGRLQRQEPERRGAETEGVQARQRGAVLGLEPRVDQHRILGGRRRGALRLEGQQARAVPAEHAGQRRLEAHCVRGGGRLRQAGQGHHRLVEQHPRPAFQVFPGHLARGGVLHHGQGAFRQLLQRGSVLRENPPGQSGVAALASQQVRQAAGKHESRGQGKQEKALHGPTVRGRAKAQDIWVG
jgi:hypothetical protein